MSWAALQSRLNTTALSRMGESLLLDGVAVQGDYVRPFSERGMASTTAPQAVVQDADVPANPVGMPVVADGTNFRVVEANPDGYGFTTLILQIDQPAP